MTTHDIIVIGASAGGVEALMKLVHDMPPNLPAAVFIVLHIPAGAPSLLSQILSRSGSLTVSQPDDKTAIEAQHIYVASPDRHMILEKGIIRVIRGPEENRHRPAIDPLFRSAALVYGSRVIGVVLTGALDDGTAGLLSIKQRGGIALVQDPQDALYPSMPQSAISYVHVDHVLPLAKIGALLSQLSHAEVPNLQTTPADKVMQQEVSIAAMNPDALHKEPFVGEPSVFSCPECGGVLWELHDNGLTRFRCRTGHAFSPESIQEAQGERIENALWVALKTLEEKVSFSRRMVQNAKNHQHLHLAQDYEYKIREMQRSADTISDLLRQGVFSETTDLTGNIQ